MINPETGLAYNNKYGYRSGTKECNRNRALVQNYGLTITTWEELFAKQNNICAICSTDQPRGKNWHTDHDHKTGKIRGILCGWCNTALGKFQDSPDILKKASEYLDKNE